MFESASRVGAVRSWRLIDTEQIAVYDFSGMSFDEARGRLTIEGNIPLTIEGVSDRLGAFRQAKAPRTGPVMRNVP